MKKLLFVCLGNICRSPTAEAVFRKRLAQQNIKAHLDSAGTVGNHIGERSDPRSIRHAEKRGYEMTHLARKVCQEDFHEFDLLFAMDNSNYQNLMSLCPDKSLQKKIHRITDFRKELSHPIVPDPYYGNSQDFELVIDILEDCVDVVIERFFKEA